MMPEQAELLGQARHSLSAAQLLQAEGYAGRAYYAMFYIAEAFLLGKGLAFSKHSGVHAAFGTHCAKTGVVPSEFHRYLIRSMEVRHAGDYGNVQAVTTEEAAEQITRAEQFLALAFRLIGPIPLDDKQPG